MGAGYARYALLIWLLCWSALAAPAQVVKSTPSASSSAPIQVYFGPKAADDPNGVLFNLMRFFDTAQTTIYGSAHEIDMVVVAEKLAEKAAAGIDVEVVVESRWMDLPKDRAAINILKNSKVKLIPDTKKSGLMHNKFFIIDKKRVWTGSTNLTEHCLLFNYNNGIWVEDGRVAENFLNEFYREREGIFGIKGGGATTPYPIAAVGNARVATYFSPEDRPLPKIVAMIGEAKQSIDVLCFVFSSKEITEALLAAHKRGVKIRVLLDNSFSSIGTTSRWKYVPFKELSKDGIACKYDDEVAKVHHKVIIIDGHEVMTGSFNLSNNAAKANNENVLIVDAAEVGGQYEKEFERLWNFFSGDPGKAPEPDYEDKEHDRQAAGEESNEDNNQQPK
jgi:phosphatidylserine/phosphatidylglycerophosphate/cardiolipin synthase-like enzyme